MFLGQVSTDDVQADGCAAKYYHEAMQANNATSELHLIPLDRQRCYAVGQPEDPAASKASLAAVSSATLAGLRTPRQTK